MWKNLFNIAKSCFVFGEKLDQQGNHIRKLREDVDYLLTAMERLTSEFNAMRQLQLKENEVQRERYEKLLLQLELQLVKFEKRLPPPTK
jgi:hypothetical protein